MKFTKFNRLELLIPKEDLQEPVTEVKKTTFDETDEDTKEQMRSFAHAQLAKSHPNIHKKLKNYD